MAPAEGQLTLFEVDALGQPTSTPEVPSPKPASADRHNARLRHDVEGPSRRPRSPVAGSDRDMRHHTTARELLETPCALLTRTHLRELGMERRAIDAVFRRLPVVSLPGYSRPMIRVEQFLELIREHTYRDDRVRPSHA